MVDGRRAGWGKSYNSGAVGPCTHSRKTQFGTLNCTLDKRCRAFEPFWFKGQDFLVPQKCPYSHGDVVECPDYEGVVA